MQSGRQLKKAQDYAIGEHVYEGDLHMGRVAAIAFHPTKKSVAYILVVNVAEEYTIYKALKDIRCGLSLTRNIPESVAVSFAVAIQKGDFFHSGPSNVKKFPVITKPQKPVAEPESEPQEPTGPGAPYFDFV